MPAHGRDFAPISREKGTAVGSFEMHNLGPSEGEEFNLGPRALAPWRATSRASVSVAPRANKRRRGIK